MCCPPSTSNCFREYFQDLSRTTANDKSRNGDWTTLTMVAIVCVDTQVFLQGHLSTKID